MYGVDMYNTVKTLLLKGKSQGKIVAELGISRNTVSDIAKSIAAVKSWPTPQNRPKKLSEYHNQIRELVKKNKYRYIFDQHMFA